MGRGYVIDEQPPGPLQLRPIAPVDHAIRLTEEPVEDGQEVIRFEAGIGVPVGEANEVEGPDQLSQAGERLPGGEPPVCR